MRVARFALVAFILASPALALDQDSLRVRKDPGGVLLSWTDPTPTVACVSRDATAPPSTIIQQVAGLSYLDAAPSVPLLFYAVDEPASGSCGALPPRCASAGTLSCGTTLTSRNDGAGGTNAVSAYAGCPGPDASGPEIAYSFTATDAGTHVVTLANAAGGLGLRVLRDAAGECDPAQCLAFTTTTVNVDLLAGETVYVVIDGAAGATGSFELSVTCPSTGGSCSPVGMLGCGSTDSRNTADAGSSSALSEYPGCFAGGLTGREMIYAFTPTADDSIEVRLMAGAAAADVLVLQDAGGGCATADCIAFGDVLANFAATAGQTYYIVVDAPAGPGVTYTVALTCRAQECQPDQSVLCGQAIAHNSAWPVFTDVNDAYPCSTFAYPGTEYTFRFTATGDGQATAALSNTTADLDVFVLVEGAGCNPDACIAWDDMSATFPITAGTTYDIVVDGRDGAEGFFRLDLSCTSPPSACEPHGTIRCGDLVGNDSAAGRDAVNAWPACTSLDESGPEYVYLFAPVESATVRVVMDLNTEDLDLIVVQDQGAGCDPSGCIAWGDTEVTFDAAAGSVYYVIVDGRAGASDIFRLWMDCQRVPGACRPAQPIACGQTVSGRNDAPGSTDAIDRYDCLPYPEDGPEFTYAFTPSTDGTARLTLSSLTADMDVFVLRDDGLGCNQQSCVAGANQTVDVPVTAGTTYYVVVEGFTGATGSYDLTLDCL